MKDPFLPFRYGEGGDILVARGLLGEEMGIPQCGAWGSKTPWEQPVDHRIIQRPVVVVFEYSFGVESSAPFCAPPYGINHHGGVVAG